MKIINDKILLICIIFMVLFFNKSTGTGPYTELAIGSKSYAMGQTATISYPDLFGSINYPANLSQSNKITSALYYSSPFGDTKNMRFGLSIPLKGQGTIGFSYFYFIVDDIISRNAAGVIEGTAAIIQHEYVISYGRNISDNILFGLNGKWIANEFTNVGESYSGDKNISLDFSVGYLPHFDNAWLKGLGFGFTLKNFIQVNTNDDHIPQEYRLIAENSYYRNKDSIHLTVNYLWYENFAKEYITRLHAGLEYGYDFAFFRIGYNDDRFTAGTGININFLSIDYGYGSGIGNNYYNRDQHNFTLSVIF